MSQGFFQTAGVAAHLRRIDGLIESGDWDWAWVEFDKLDPDIRRHASTMPDPEVQHELLSYCNDARDAVRSKQGDEWRDALKQILLRLDRITTGKKTNEKA